MSRYANFFAVAFLILLPLVYFWRITLAQGVWFGNDMVRTYYPLGVELARAFQQGRLPLWTTGMYAGFPIFADAQIGALYPVNWILYRILPPHTALSYNLLLHLAWAGLGMYLLARVLGLRVASALLAGLVFAFSGFMLARLMHATVLMTSAWLPWAPFLWEHFQRARTQNDSKTQIWFALTSLALGIQFLCGFPQIAFINTLTFALFALCGVLWHSPHVISFKTILTLVASIGLTIMLALGVSAAQIIPTFELVGYSLRSAIDFEFATEYSFPLDFLPHLVFPLWQGEPADANSEYWAYLGVAPLFLAILAPLLRCNRRTIFFALVALGALALALGRASPLYSALYALPGFSFFRVPARYLLVFVFASALLSAIAFDELAQRLPRVRSTRAVWWSALYAIAFLLSIWLAETQPLEFWSAVERIAPPVFLIATLLWFILAWQRRLARATFQIGLLGLALLDVTGVAPLFVKTLGQLTPPANVTVVPRSLSILDSRLGQERVLTDQSFFPSVPSIRNSLFPNTALIYGKEHADAYSSLPLTRHVLYLSQLTPAMLNLLNVRYFAIPLEPRPQTKRATPGNTLALGVLDDEEMIPPTQADALEIISFTENAEHLADGTVVGQIELRRRDGRADSFPLRVGIETADWDYARKQPQHSRAPIAHTFPAYWRAFGRTFDGASYTARFSLEPSEWVGVQVRVLRPDTNLTIESVTLYNRVQGVSLAQLARKNDWRIAYMSDTVAVWENLNVLPRAFIVHRARVMDDGAAFARMCESTFDPAREVLLSEGRELREFAPARGSVELTNYAPERVAVRATTDQPAYLVLTDSWYPGWEARVDGQPAPIYRANILFRAVPIEAGTHDITFEYRPRSFVLGALISAVSLCIVLGILLWRSRKIQ